MYSVPLAFYSENTKSTDFCFGVWLFYYMFVVAKTSALRDKSSNTLDSDTCGRPSVIMLKIV